MPNFLGLCPEVRCIIYSYLFPQPGDQILALSREPKHDYSKSTPSSWYADSRQEGLVYGSHTARTAPTNASFLRTCRLINTEATPIFYGANKIVVYAEDNNDIFYWLLDIGERNRRAIRHLEIGWAYGVSIESGRGNLHGILQNIEDMEDSEEDEIKKHRQQLIEIVKRLETKTTRLIVRTINLLVTNQDLQSLSVYLPGIDGGDIWDLPNPNLYFAEELFSNSTTNVHACIPEALAKMIGIKTLTIGYTKDIELAEKIARATGAKHLLIETRPEGDTLMLNAEEQAKWRSRDWRLEGRTAKKTLVTNIVEDYSGNRTEKESKSEMQGGHKSERWSEGGRLKASMLYGTESDGSSGAKHD
ncbi:MAG: hypothetical protein ASARMPREDX12_008402 [Alectoria sarmentosa]|nr:MAG: hypothetical protein ASARMPREDX12_008402 [Alectoria sarmentosa]